MRLFTAIELPAEVCDALSDAQTDLKKRIDAKVSWVSPKNLHVTMKFLGEVPDAEVVKVCEALKSVAFSRFRISVSQLGTLPPRGKARVLMAQVGGEVDALGALFNAIEAACEPLGFVREKRRFFPHVTLARLRMPRRIDREIGEVKLKPTAAFEVQQFVLYQSRLSARGAEYEAVAHFQSAR
jgi:2'-5' RNA ligase